MSLINNSGAQHYFLSSPNAKWPMSLSHNRLQTGGWARQQNSEWNDGLDLHRTDDSTN